MALMDAALLAEARTLQESLMIDTVVLERHDGDTLDAWKTATPTWTKVYGGPGLVQASTLQPSQADSAGRAIIIKQVVGKLPWTVVIDDRTEYRLRVTASADPGNVGTYAVIAGESQGLETCRRIHLARS
ncbi:hypothetical protein GCM10009785_34840 [Brooklawnia cerclae]|uniref:Head-tail adaptor protein n=1 Tax=Brooklawnia cerclae TaxID=349934 RepID=A0ABX0SJA0_9ACTN|nr:DUF6093 family protein [Brooklawnia cerclae]NIH58473.1 hypothetical protein [Brooklawnia cerclae]